MTNPAYAELEYCGTDVARAALAVLDQDRQARVLLNSSRQLLWANQRARGILSSGRGLEVRDGVLVSTRPGAPDEVAALLQRCDDTLASLVLQDKTDNSHLILRCRRMSLSPSTVFALTIISSGHEFGGSYIGVDSAFRLTQSEYRVLCALMAGQDVDAIATASNVSVETTRSHIKSLYMKMSVNSREAMFRRAVPFLL